MKEAVPVKDDSVGGGLDLEDALSVSVYSPTTFFLFLGLNFFVSLFPLAFYWAFSYLESKSAFCSKLNLDTYSIC